MRISKKDAVEPHMRLLGILFSVLSKVRKQGLMSIEGDIESPEGSPLFAADGKLFVDPVIQTFMCDILRLMVGGNLNDMEVKEHIEHCRETTTLTGIQTSLFDVVRYTLVASMRGYAPQVAAEFGRAGIPDKLKPTFNQVEDYLKSIRMQSGNVAIDLDTRINEFYESINR